MQKVSYRLPSTHEGPAIYLSITGRCMASSHRILGSRQSRHYLHQRVIVQMRKLRTGGLPKVIQRTSGRAGARIHAAGRASAPSPTTRPSFGAETGLPTPTGTRDRGPARGRRVKATQWRPQLSPSSFAAHRAPGTLAAAGRRGTRPRAGNRVPRREPLGARGAGSRERGAPARADARAHARRT